jgi:stage II sporulation protein D (peptidoglycan lytic transglycosylase)
MKPALQPCICALVLILFAAPTPVRAARVRIGVFTLFHPKVLTFAPGPGHALIVKGGKSSVVLGDGAPARCRIGHSKIECRAGERLLSSMTIRVAGRADTDEDFTLSVPGRIVRNFHGKLKILSGRADLVPVVNMDLEVAVASAVAAESPSLAPLEALEAQAVVTRSYYAAAPHRHKLFDFCDTTHCQFLREAPAPESLASQAALMTRGLVLFYRGTIVPALFSASCGGWTRTLREIGMHAEGYPYFSIRCEACLHNAKKWTARISLHDAAPILAHKGWEEARLQVDRKLGWEAIPSDNYTVKIEGKTVVLTGRGAGHGVGLCQLGTAALARHGWSCSRILGYYFPGTTIGNRSDH